MKSRHIIIPRNLFRNWLGVKSGWFHHGDEGALTLSQVDRIDLSPPIFTCSVAFDKNLDFPELPAEWAQCPLSLGIVLKAMGQSSACLLSGHLLGSFV